MVYQNPEFLMNYLKQTYDSSMEQDELDKSADSRKETNRRQSFTAVVSFLWQEAYQSYSSHYIIKWSFWVIISTCINYQVGNYIQPLWEEIMPSTNSSGSDGESFVNTNLRQSFESFHRKYISKIYQSNWYLMFSFYLCNIEQLVKCIYRVPQPARPI